MRRKPEEIFSFKAISYIRYLPLALATVKNWPLLLLNYIGIEDEGAVYQLRNGLHIRTGDGHGAAILFAIFLERGYGAVPFENSVVIDIGAHVGMYSLYASQSKNTKVYAFEPSPENFSLLQENIQQNSLTDRVFAWPFAVGPMSGRMRLYLRQNASGLHSFLPVSKATFQITYRRTSSNETSLDVPCISLKDIFDQHNISRCEVLKIDCEGAEYDILYALPKAYFQRIQTILVEYHHYSKDEKYTGRALLSFLENQGFHIQKIMKLRHQGTAWLTR